MLYSAIMGAGLGNDVAMLTDGRFSGGSHGFIIGHITPEAYEGGPIALLEDGDPGERIASHTYFLEISQAKVASNTLFCYILFYLF